MNIDKILKKIEKNQSKYKKLIKILDSDFEYDTNDLNSLK